MKSIIFIAMTLGFINQGIAQTKSFQKEGKTYQYEAFNTVKIPRALLVLFNGGNGKAAGIPPETKLPQVAEKEKFLTIGIDQSQFFINDSTYEYISTVIHEIMLQENITQYFIGGMSLGGFTALRYTEMVVERQDTSLIPGAIFGVDPPIDHIAMRDYCFRELERDCSNEAASNLGKGEAKWILNYYEQAFGDFSEHRENYIQQSCFSAELEDGGNARYLKAIPINMIHELDPMWLIQERCRDITDSNLYSSSKLINYLYNQGNKNAKITLTQNLGYRSNGLRHPHSWSIAEPNKTLDWLKQFLTKN